jgi:hypothetical protein
MDENIVSKFGEGCTTVEECQKRIAEINARFEGIKAELKTARDTRYRDLTSEAIYLKEQKEIIANHAKRILIGDQLMVRYSFGYYLPENSADPDDYGKEGIFMVPLDTTDDAIRLKILELTGSEMEMLDWDKEGGCDWNDGRYDNGWYFFHQGGDGQFWVKCDREGFEHLTVDFWSSRCNSEGVEYPFSL